MKTAFKFASAFAIILSATVFTAKAQQVNDADIKKNAAPVTNSLSFITRLEPVTYEYNKSDNKKLNLPEGKQYGFIASDAEQVTPWAIKTQNSWQTIGKNQQKAITTHEVDLQKLVPLLVGAIKEQQAEIEKLKQEVEALKKK
ncbi:tail fiber domain-containing protein [Mucilaginibacter myungsuensis]|uniref:Tail fiber domain-containing protein n=1 Tax=Mucilaginibacter myungsuensis TaxID=649104 RepID=A0A929PZA3_9SPHI|nr:tail fiber domain-containing protein [Mucilaginibacter myungsuensis]MBE9664207.1 tail fiber domain-containing protein [Mucilaginibacter myungsuensis]MDN3599909.1 tail fiber domain-containing protein [Mucilaginibacter myungsuensis]